MHGPNTESVKNSIGRTSSMMLPIAVHLLILFGYSTSALTNRCFLQREGGSLCFTQPDPPVALSWSSAGQWCKNIGATLPIPDTYYHIIAYENAVSYFGLHTETLWLAANSTYNLNNWHWTNGKIFTGSIENRNSPGKTHGYILRNGTNVKFVAASPFDSSYMYFICQDDGTVTGTSREVIESRFSSNLPNSSSAECLASYRTYNFNIEWININCATQLQFICQQYVNVTTTTTKTTETAFSATTSTTTPAARSTTSTSTTSTTTTPSYSLETASDGETAKSSMETVKSSMETAKSSMETVKSSMETAKSSMETVKSSMETAKSSMETVKSSTETVKMTYFPEVNGDSHSINYSLALAIGFGLGGGLLMTLTAWLALLTICAFRKIREARHSQTSRQRQTDGDLNTTASRSHDNSAYKDATEATEEPGEVYEALELQPNEHVYQPMSHEDQ